MTISGVSADEISAMYAVTDNNKIVGVRFRPEKNRYEARIGVNGKPKVLGLFLNEIYAIKARKEGEKQYYGKICSC